MTSTPERPVTLQGPGSAASAEEADLRGLFGESTALFASMAGPIHLLEAANPAFFTAVGRTPERTGLPLGQLMPEFAEQGFITLLNRATAPASPAPAAMHGYCWARAHSCVRLLRLHLRASP
ncbi:hypothetical protein [Streptomyces sp. NPDC020965]|uniref:hypothetical protein n=1 Tax=Streptomyces sp. NPDC020965 TaxID=3365105 RepID=UPI00378E264C